MSDIKALDPALLKQYSAGFNADRANLVAANAAVSSGVLAAATDYKGERVLQNDFSIELKQGSITNQRSSGRCWMFAALNTLRYELMHRWNLEDFEFSETYLFFWDAMEKSNTYLENVLATLDEPLDSRVFEAINYGPADDGGWWQMFANLVNKDDGKKKTAGEGSSEKAAKTGKDERPQIREFGITPMEFYKKYVPVDVNDLVTLCNVPMESRPFGKRYRIRFSANVAEAGDMEFVNVSLDVFKKAAVDQISGGHPIWFACDCMQFSLRGDGYFDCDTVRVDQLFGTEFTFDKATGLEYGDCPSNHAMTLTGVNLDADGRPNRWKVENSWGKDNGQDGYYVASDAWFDRYVTELIIRKEYLDEATREVLATQPVELEPWEPLTKRSR